MGCILYESGTNGAECSRKMAGGRRVAGVIRSLVNDRDLQIVCARVPHESLHIPVLMYGVKQCYGKRRKERSIFRGCTDGQP